MEKLNKRQRDILTLAEEEGYVSVEGLAKTFEVTQQTIRSDINNFCDQDLLVRAHGGAFFSKAHDYAYKSRKTLASNEKKDIADAVANIIPNSSSIVLGNIYSAKSGTTIEQVAQSLYAHKDLKVITNNINIVNIFTELNNAEIWLA